jgi:hypothetical protein
MLPNWQTMSDEEILESIRLLRQRRLDAREERLRKRVEALTPAKSQTIETVYDEETETYLKEFLEKGKGKKK